MEDSGEENWFRIFIVYRNMGHEERGLRENFMTLRKISEIKRYRYSYFFPFLFFKSLIGNKVLECEI